jgi:hypothetical protein
MNADMSHSVNTMIAGRLIPLLYIARSTYDRMFKVLAYL